MQCPTSLPRASRSGSVHSSPCPTSASRSVLAYRAARAERGGQVDDVTNALRPRAALARHCPRARPNPAADVEVAGSIGLVPQQETVFEPLTANRFVQLTAKLHGLPDPRPWRRRRSNRWGSIQPTRAGCPRTRRGCASGQGGAGPRPRSTRRHPGRAADRARPAATARHDPALPTPRRGGAMRARLEPRSRRGRAARLLDSDDVPGAALGRRRLPRAPGDDGRPSAPCPGAHRSAARARRRSARDRCCGRCPPRRRRGLEIDTNDARGLARALAPPPASGASLFEIVPLDADLRAFSATWCSDEHVGETSLLSGRRPRTASSLGALYLLTVRTQSLFCACSGSALLERSRSCSASSPGALKIRWTPQPTSSQPTASESLYRLRRSGSGRPRSAISSRTSCSSTSGSNPWSAGSSPPQPCSRRSP